MATTTDVTSEIIREDPPKRAGRRGGTDWNKLLDSVAQTPNEWFRIATYDKTGAASATAHRLRAEKIAAERAEGVWEFTSRRLQGSDAGVDEFGVYAKYNPA
jgi:hypothetical protein